MLYGESASAPSGGQQIRLHPGANGTVRIKENPSAPHDGYTLVFLSGESMNTTFSNSSADRIDAALRSLQNGRGIIVADDEDRENEGDLIFAAESLTVPQMAQMIRECSGIVCLCLTEEKVASLGLSMMTEHNRSRFSTAFTVSIEAAEGVSTGVSAADRVTTIRAAIADDASPLSICSPGHVFPLKARRGGVLERAGHTEATVDMMRLAGLKPCGVLCELTNPDGTMMKMKELTAFAQRENLPMVTVEDIRKYMTRNK
jgi:3,4-dihydroxy 2-butanone 4-phosphate synthase